MSGSIHPTGDYTFCGGGVVHILQIRHRVKSGKMKTPPRNERFDAFRLRKYSCPWGDTDPTLQGLTWEALA